MPLRSPLQRREPAEPPAAQPAGEGPRTFPDRGLPEDRIAQVVGKANTEPLDPAHPHAAKNRSVSIVLLREPT